MKTKLNSLLISTVILLVVVMAGCSTTKGMEISFNGKECVYSGPAEIKAGYNSVNFKAAKDKSYGIEVVKLLDNKTKADLDAWTDTDPPSWVETIHGTGNRSEDFEWSLKVDSGPIYLVCFTGYPIEKLNSIGPIEVIK